MTESILHVACNTTHTLYLCSFHLNTKYTYDLRNKKTKKVNQMTSSNAKKKDKTKAMINDKQKERKKKEETKQPNVAERKRVNCK